MNKKLSLCGLLICLVLSFVSRESVAQMTGTLTQTTYSIADTDKLYLTVVGPKEDAKYQQLTGLFASDPQFAAVADNSHFHAMPTNSTMYQSRYMKDFSAFPAVRIQTMDGKVVKEWSGAGIPADSELLKEMQCLPRWRKNPQPTPKPTPTPTPAPAPPVKPAVQPSYVTFWGGVVAVVLGCVVAVWHEQRNS